MTVGDKNDILKALQGREAELADKVAELEGFKTELGQVREAIKALGGVNKSLLATNGYISAWVWTDKIKYVVKQRGKASNHDIAEFVAKKDGRTVEDILPVVSSMTSKMLKQGDLGVEKTEDGRNIYLPIEA